MHKKLVSFLKQYFPYHLIQSEMRKKNLLVNKIIIRNNISINPYDVIKIAGRMITYYPEKSQVNLLKEPNYIIHEDNNYIICNKPAGLTVQGGKGIKIHMLGELKSYCSSIRIVHRLDRATSGLIIFVKNIDSARKMGKAFQDRKVRKYYLTIIYGKFDHTYQIQSNNFTEQKMISTFIPLSKNKKYTLFLVKLHTGRKHQIRQHATLLNTRGILGESKTFSLQTNLFIIKRASVSMSNILDTFIPQSKKLYLHSWRIEWDNYCFVTNKIVNWIS